MTAVLSGLPGGGRVLGLEDVVAAYDDPSVSWAITTTGHLHHLTRGGAATTLCGRRARPSSEPSHPHAVCRPCLDKRVDEPEDSPASRPRPSTTARRPSGPHPKVDWASVSPRLEQCNRLGRRFFSEALDHRGDLVWLKGTERPNVDPIAEADAWTSYYDIHDLWAYVWHTEVTFTPQFGARRFGPHPEPDLPGFDDEVGSP